MSWMDLLRMSGSNLKRRKLRTFLTVLGVVIGTASIVVMISLGLGMQKSIYDEIENSGGLTTIKVTAGGEGGGMTEEFEGESSSEEEEKYIDDKFVASLAELEHVTMAAPAYEMDVLLLKSSYESYGMLLAMTPEALKARGIDLGAGRLPESNSGQLELLYGNTVITNFYNKNGGEGYWETGELPDIDLMKDSVFLILDQENYYGSGGSEMGEVMEIQADEEGGAAASKPAQKHVVRACGMVEGGPEDWNANSSYIFCDLDTLKKTLKKEFAGRTIPGQPETKSGRPGKEFYYSYAQVKVDDIENVEDVSSLIRSMGYEVETNIEYLDSMKKQLAVIQAVLGGIGAVSLLVAAIGIANTMMMSIYERTKEIGVIKVLGCSLKNIKQMFLLEAAFIGLIGGVVGNILSALMSAGINFIVGQSNSLGVEGNISYIPFWMVAMSILFAIFVGVAAGYFPALRAMKLSPLAAIRNE